MSEFTKATKCNIRTATIDDAEVVLDIQISVFSEGDYFISESEEFSKTPAEQREWIQGLLENEKNTLLVAEVNGEVVGWVVFISQDRKRTAHTGSFGIMISKKYRGIGVGKRLLTALLDWAEKNPLIEKVSLGVFSTNDRAISMYRKMGFTEEGRKIKEFKMKENVYVDDILMYKLV
ncbi:GNAT family N-acetyltransferase [Bacillus sp. 2205SS5-2]|uniref:GNAT family N-acetyltransferase n=1 Tax=Bacillus sp. 2205SS5-2 TaxID=3109031 RepID=UPI0030067425